MRRWLMVLPLLLGACWPAHHHSLSRGYPPTSVVTWSPTTSLTAPVAGEPSTPETTNQSTIAQRSIATGSSEPAQTVVQPSWVVPAVAPPPPAPIGSSWPETTTTEGHGLQSGPTTTTEPCPPPPPGSVDEGRSPRGGYCMYRCVENCFSDPHPWETTTTTTWRSGCWQGPNDPYPKCA